jgi:general secretion pathway protein E
MSASASPRLIGELLRDRGQIAAADLERALAAPRRGGERLGQVLVRLGALSEEQLLAGLVEQTGMPLAELGSLARAGIDAALQQLGWSAERLLALRAVIWLDDAGALHAAAEDPLEPGLREAVETVAGLPLRWAFARGRELERLLAGLRVNDEASWDAARWRELAEDGPVIAFVNNLLGQAIEERASDVHMEPGEFGVEVRFRIDGVLHGRAEIGLDRYPAVASRIKLIAGLDIAERRLPQDGRITLRAAGSEMDLRVSVVPAGHGESIVMRLLPKQRQDLSLDRLGLADAQREQLKRWLGLGSGLILVTGPTGSGKSTTLYAALSAVNDRQRKILTVEDPVEHRMAGVVQVQVQPDIGYSFARALRAFLRHDPDIIMVGEIRDRETAEIAVQSALTGHLVLATLHTNDALSSFTRLIDMGVEPYLVAASVKAVMAQRLVRRLCSNCQQPDEAPPGEGVGQWRKAIGCAHCQNTGYQGRFGIYELVGVDMALQHAIASTQPMAEIEALANAAGRRSLRQDGLVKAAQGLTTVAEVGRVVGEAL